MPAFGHHDPHQIGGVLGAELLHDAGAVHLDGARADAELPAGLLVGVSASRPGNGIDMRSDAWLGCLRRSHAAIASRTSDTTVTASNGFSMKSRAPFLIASTAIGISPCPEMMKIGAS